MSACWVSPRSPNPARVETDEHTAFDRLATVRVARLATLGPSGRLDLVPITFAVTANRRVVTAVDHKPKTTVQLQRLANVRAHPDAVTVLADHYDDDWEQLWWIRLRGRGRVVDGGPDLDEAVAALAAKYEQYRRHRPIGPAIVIDVREWRGWEATAVP